MRLTDVVGCSHTATVLPAVPTHSSAKPFWGTCAAPLYASAGKFPSQTLAQLDDKLVRSLRAPDGSAGASFASMQTELPTQGARRQERAALPCPVLYQAKEPEAISAVLRRAGNKALGGGIPGDLFIALVTASCCRDSPEVIFGCRVRIMLGFSCVRCRHGHMSRNNAYYNDLP